MKDREIQCLGRCQPANKWQSQDSISDNLAVDFVFLTVTLDGSHRNSKLFLAHLLTKFILEELKCDYKCFL